MSHHPNHAQPICCPLYTAADVIPCDPAELQPLLSHLRCDTAVNQPLTFPRGTVMEDGRLDLCKQALGMRGCRMVTDALADNHSVVSLMLGTDGIGNAGASDVAGLIEKNSAIETLYLGCNRIDTQGVAALAASLTNSVSVRGLWLKRNPIGPDGAKHLADMLRWNKTLRTLDLVNTRIGTDGLAALAQVLTGTNHSLERLYLGGNWLGPEEAPLLADLLRETRLRALLLNVGNLGNDGAVLLASALGQNTTLEELGLASNGIGPDGGAAILAAASGHPALTHLDLGYGVSTRALGASANFLGDTGADEAAHCLARNPRLVRLDLRGNGITAWGVEQIAQALEDNTRLRSLVLDGKPHPALAEYLERNQAASPDTPPPQARDVALTRSVYRTA